jgi:hypothetical protein
MSTLSDAQIRQRREAATRHGAKSGSAVAARAKTIELRFLREQRLKRSDLDGLALGYLRGYSSAMAKVGLYDDHSDLAGSREYVSALNAGRLWLAKLEQRLRVLGRDRAQPAAGSALRDHLERTYGNGGDKP